LSTPPAKSAQSVGRLFGPRPVMPELDGASIRGGAAMFLANVGARVVRLVSMLVLARLLTPADFGVLAVVMAYVGVAGLLYELGLATATVQRSTLTSQQVSALFWINTGAGAGLAVGGLLAAPWLGRLYGDPRIEVTCELLALRPLLGALGVQHLALLQRAMRFRESAAIGLFATAVGSAASVLLAWQGWSFVALALGSLIASAITVALAWIVCPWRPGRPRMDPAVREMVGYGAYLVGFGFLGTLGTGLHSMLLALVADVESAGLYQRAYSLLQLLQGLTLGAVAAVAMSALSQLQGQPEAFRLYYLRCATFLATVCAPAAAAGLLFADELMRVLFGPQWVASGPLFAIMCVGLVCYALSYSTGWIYLATGQVRRMMHWGVIGWAGVIVGTLIGLPLGLRGLAIAQTVSMVLIVVPCLAMAFRGTQITLGSLWLSIWRPLLAALVAAGVTALARGMLPEAALPRLAVGVSLFGGIYLLLLSEALGQRPQLLFFGRQLLGRGRRAPTAS
jgi:PST family polysaccharide transporter